MVKYKLDEVKDYVVEINIEFLNEIESEKRQVMLLFGV